MQSVLYKKCKACYTFLQSLLCSMEEHSLKTNIRQLRKERRISQEELASAVGTTRQTITSIETGKYVASLPLAYKIAKHFGLTIEEVFDLSGDMEER